MLLINLILFASGFWLIYMCNSMKSTGVIPKQLISNKINIERAKDVPGYIKHMYPRGIAFGIFLSALSALMILNLYVPLNYFVNLFIQLLFIAGIVVYAVMAVKAQNRFLI